jgi:hypothetical protein
MWVNVEAVDGYENNVTLASGDTINLESYQTSFVWIFSTITFVIGMGWMFYWTLRKRTVQNLAVTSQIPLNTDGMSVGLITKADHRNMNLFLIVTVALTVGMFIWQAVVFPDKLPQQVIEFAPPVAEQPGPAPTAIGTEARWNASDNVMTLTARVTNTGDSDIELAEFTISTLTFTNPDVGEEAPGGAEMSVEPSATIGGGDTEELTLSLPDPRWEDDQLIPTAESQFEIAGLLVFNDGTFAEVHAPLLVDF